jgi:transcriptional regulator with XRE-family HTH domain
MMFGDAIQHLRQLHGMPLREVARKSGVSVSYLHDVERGKRAPFPDDKRAKVYYALGLDVGQRAELDVLRIFTLGTLDITGLSENAVRQLIALRDELRAEEDGT